MDTFTHLTSLAAPLLMENVDTDLIIPKQFLKTLRRTGLGPHLFADLRYAPDGAERPDFVLNREPWRQARILLSGANFGCGSSREHAPWALLDQGIRCVIAPSFADIFYGNCFKNGILPLILPLEHIQSLEGLGAQPLSVDLPAQTVSGGGLTFGFELDPFRKQMLLEGLDEIAQTELREGAIAAFEARQRTEQPWLWTPQAP